MKFRRRLQQNRFRGLIEPMEPRLLFNADVMATMAVEPASLAAAEVQVMPHAAAPVPVAAQQQPVRELVFVDAGVDDAALLMEGLQQQAGSADRFELHWLQADRDGVAQIGEVLAGRQDIAAVHLISHGADGQLMLGNTVLTAETLAGRAEALSAWSGAFQAQGDILIYGCDVAATASGQAFVRDLALLTGADVAASADVTGVASLGGDWMLEFSTDGIEAGTALDASTQVAWEHVLTLATSSGETLVNGTTTGTQSTTTTRQVGIDASGNHVVVWQDAGNVKAKVLSTSGTTVVSDFTVAAGTEAQVAMNASGQFVVVWNDGSGVNAQRYNANGSTSGSVITLATTNTAELPSVALNDAGNFVVSWSEHYLDNAFNYYRDVNAAVYSWSGVVKAPFVFSSGLSNNYTDANSEGVASSVAIDSAGRFVIVTDHGGSIYGSTMVNIYMWSFDASGSAIVSKARVNPDTTYSRRDPTVSMDNDGHVAVAWTTVNGSATGIWYQRMDYATGTRQDDTALLASQNALAASTASLSLNPQSGNFTIAWMAGNDVYLREFSGVDSTALTSIRQINTTSSGNQIMPSIASRGMYTAVVWSGNGAQPGQVDGAGVFEQRYLLSNVAPVNTVPAAAQSTIEDTQKVFSSGNGNQISIADSDAGGASVQVTLSVLHGSLTLSGASGLSFSQGDGSGDASMVFTGTVANINTALNGLSYMPGAHYSGADTLTLITNDQGNTGSDGAKSDTDTVTLRVTPVNDATVNTKPAAQALNEDGTLVFSSLNGTLMAVSDVDAESMQVTVSALHGTLTLAQTTGLSFSAGDGTADASMSLTGTVANINAALNGMVYAPTSHYNGADTITLSSQDRTLATLNADTSLKGRYAFESTGSLGTDTSPDGGRDATVTSVTSVNNGTRGNVASFNGNANLAFAGLYGKPADATLSAWVNLTTSDTRGAEVISLGDSLVLRLDDTGNGYGLAGIYYDGGGRLYNSSFHETSYATTLAGQGWHHVAFSFDDTNHVATLYLDGVAVSTSTPSSSISYAGATTTYIGKNGGANYPNGYDFTGLIDEARLYTRALTASEIAALASDLPAPNTDSDNVAVTVNAVNDAPVLTGTSNFNTITEDQTGNSGQLVSSLFTSTDVDTGAASGIAVHTLSSGSGTWQYSTNGGSSWNSVGAVSSSSALLLRSTDRVRFVPDGANADAASISFYAWDQTSGTVGSKVDAGTRGSATAFSSTGGTASITVSAVNDAPVLTGTNNFTAINEDDTASSGTLITALLSGFGSDVDSAALSGIAVTAVDNSHGAWQYTTNGGGNWTAFGSPGATTARLLAGDASTRIRFVPTANWSGSASITYRAWDQVAGTAGNTADVSSNGGTTAFSATTASPTITVNAVSDAPVLTGTSNFTSITEDQTGNVGQQVSTLFASTDGDSGALSGIAIHTLASGSGTWQYSLNGGSSWNSVGAVSSASALLLRSTDFLRFVPDGLNADTVSVAFHAWDQTSGSAGGKVDVGTRGGATSFSSAGGTSAISVTAVNDAPTLAGTTNFIGITEDDTGNAGQLVSSLITSSDGDAGAASGIAVHTLVSGSGAWQYSVNGGSSWSAIGSVASSSALLLRSTDLVRFVPNGQNADAGSIAFYAWDQTAGSAGGKVDAGTRGTTTAFSLGGGTSAVTVSGVNDAPVLSGTNNLTAINEDSAGGSGTLISALLSGQSSDVDSGAAGGVAVTAVDNSNGTWQYTTDGGGSWNAFGAVAETAARLLASNGSTAIRFVPDANWSGGASITYRAWDQSAGVAGGTLDASTHGGTTAFSAASASPSITVHAVNDAPTTVATALDPTYTEGAGPGSVTAPVALFSGSAVSVVEAGQTITSLTLTVTGLVDGASEKLVVDGSTLSLNASTSGTTATNAMSYSITAGAGSATLTLSKVGGITAAAAQSLIDALAYQNTNADRPTAGNRVVTLTQVRDNGGTSNGGADTATPAIASTVNVVPVNDTPVANSDNASTLPTAPIDIVVKANDSDPDHAVATLTVVIVSNSAGTTATVNADGSIHFDPGATAGAQTVVYHLVDADGAISNDATVTVTVAPNTAPTGGDQSATFNEDTGYTLQSSDFGFADADGGQTLGGIRVEVLPSFGSLTLDGVAVLAGDVISAADIDGGKLVFTPGAGENGNTTLSFTVQDSLGLFGNAANTFTLQVTAVNDAPVASVPIAQSVDEDTALTFGTVGGNAIAVSDVDAASGSLRVTLSAAQGSLTLAGITGLSFITGDGTLDATMVFTGSVADINAALDGMQYTASSHYNGADTLSLTTEDLGNTGSGGSLSDSDAVGITVQAVNDAPVMLSAIDFAPIDEDASGHAGQLVSSLLSASDPDAGASGGIALYGVGNGRGTWQYSTNGGTTWAQVGPVSSASALLLRATDRLRFVPDGLDADTASVSFHAWDQTSDAAGAKVDAATRGGGTAFSTAGGTSAITVTAVNDAPVLSGVNDFAGMQEDDGSHGGTLVSTLIAGQLGDVDGGALGGIAVIGVDSAHGVWQYTLDGATWLNLGAPTDVAARLLAPDATTAIRFVPDADWHGSASITLRAWDQRSGVAGGTANAGIHGGSTAFSVASASPAITVAAVNDAPVHAVPGSQAVDEDGALVFSSGQGNALILSDIDAGVGSMQVSLSVQHGALTLAGTAGLSFITGDGAGDASMVFTGSIADINAALDGLRYDPVPDHNGTDTLTWQTSDQGLSGAGGALTRTSTVSLAIAAVNDAPVLAGINDFTDIQEDASGHPGTRVSTLIAGQIGDADAGAPTGIAVTAVDNAHGTWQYTLDGVTWSSLGAPSDATARLLAADTTSAIRFVPDADWHGGASITVRAWDQSVGIAGGTMDASVNGGTTAFSAASLSPAIMVAPVNDAPVLSGSNGFAGISEDHTGGSGTLVSTLIAGRTSDADSGALTGIAVTGVDNAHGRWQYTLDGNSWLNFGAPSDATARLLAADATTAIRFVPDADWHGGASITLRASDRSAGSAGGTLDASVSGASTSFSASASSPLITVSPVNDAPLLSGLNSLAAIQEDASGGSGTAVSLLLAGHTSDVDSGALTGMAIIAVDNSHGTWQYTLDGSLWLDLGSPTDTTARLLAADATTAIRFIPEADWHGGATLTVRAWDRISGTAGGTADASVHGAATAFSSATASAGITVSAVNDAPVMAAVNDLSAIQEDEALNAGTLVSALITGHTSDADSGALTGIAVTQVDNAHGHWQYSLDGSVWHDFGTPTDAAARLLQADLTTAIRFTADADWHGVASITLRAWDQSTGTAGGTFDASSQGGASAFSSAAGSAGIVVGSVNDAPVLALPSAQSVVRDMVLHFAGGHGNALTLSDVDAAVALLEASLSTDHGGITLNDLSGLTFLQGDGQDDAAMVFRGSASAINAALAGMRYTPASGYTGRDVLAVSLSDLGSSGAGGVGTASGSVVIDVVTGDGVIWMPPASGSAGDGAGAGDEAGGSRGATVDKPASEPVASDGDKGAGGGVMPRDGEAGLGNALVINGPAARAPAFNQAVAASPYSDTHRQVHADYNSVQQLLELLKQRSDLVREAGHLNIGPIHLYGYDALSTDAVGRGEGRGTSAPISVRVATSLAYGTGLGLTIGTVWWSARISGLITSALMSVPAWRNIDPLPILNMPDEDEDPRKPADMDGSAGGEDVEQMFDAGTDLDREPQLIR